MKMTEKSNTVASAVKQLFPVSIFESGKLVPDVALNADLDQMSQYVRSNANLIWVTNRQRIESEVIALGTKRILFKQRFLREDCGIDTSLPRLSGVLIGNIREIVEHKILSESETWIRNPNPHKQPFSFNSNIDLSATNNQLSSVSLSDAGILILQLRCMDKHYVLTFRLPEYISNRQIKRISKPRIRLISKGQYCFDFTIYEQVSQRTGRLKAGVDLGRVEPYVAVVTNANNKALAQYYASKGLKDGWKKYYLLADLSKRLYVKIEAYEQLGLDSNTLKKERDFVIAKKTRLHSELSKRQAHELSSQLSAHAIPVVHVENLKWLSGNKGIRNKSGKWSYGRQQADLTHALARRGSKVKIVSPKNSSQLCCNCSAPITHRNNRTVWCVDCKTNLDRDFNAAMNIATLNHLRKKELVNFCGVNEGNCTVSTEITVDESRPQIIKVSLPLLY